MLTLNQDVLLFSEYAYQHKQLGRGVSRGHFYFGDEWEKGATKQAKYYFMQAVLQQSSTNNIVVSRRYTIIISGLVNKSESNETHVLSDTELICYDFINYLRLIQDDSDNGLNLRVDTNVSLTDFTERDDDEVSGWFFDITISGHMGGYGCNLPINDGSIFGANYIYAGGDMPAGNFQVLINDQNGNTIQTFNTSGTYVVEVLNRVRDTITGNTQAIIDPIQ